MYAQSSPMGASFDEQPSDAEYSAEADTSESESLQLMPGWPPAKPPEHAHEWPRFGRPRPIARDSEVDL